MDKHQPIGVIDSGVGGLTVLKRLQTTLPHEDFLYLGDTARTPYGTRTREEIAAMVAQITDWLERRQVKQVVVACNTITVLGEAVIRGKHPFHVIGMSKGANLVLPVSKNKKIGVFATDFTVSTGAHKKAIQAADPAAQVFAQGCRKFVPLIEGEKFGTPELRVAVQEYADILKKDGVDTVLLSCTHYPFVQDEVEKVFGPGVKVLDPAEETAANARTDLEMSGLTNDLTHKGHCTVCFTADLERAKRLAARMLDLSRCSFEQVDILK